MSIEVKPPKAKYLDCQSCSDNVAFMITIKDSVLEDNEYGLVGPSQSFRLCIECAIDLQRKIQDLIINPINEGEE